MNDSRESAITQISDTCNLIVLQIENSQFTQFYNRKFSLNQIVAEI
jgi:hypothetical protein